MTAKTSNPWKNRPKAPADVRPSLTTKSLRKMQLVDENSPIINYLEEDIVPTNMRDAKRLVTVARIMNLLKVYFTICAIQKDLGEMTKLSFN